MYNVYCINIIYIISRLQGQVCCYLKEEHKLAENKRLMSEFSKCPQTSRHFVCSEGLCCPTQQAAKDPVQAIMEEARSSISSIVFCVFMRVYILLDDLQERRWSFNQPACPSCDS